MQERKGGRHEGKTYCPDEAAIEAAGRPVRPVQGLSSMFLYKRWCRSNMDVSAFDPPPPQVGH